ncbi:MAG: glycerol-3-phosphate dehydrogenase/oxidase [Actinomycetota bacterium]
MNRDAHLTALRTQAFDLVVIGGGATGAGTALDAASRGLKVALIERDDFGAGASSRSTKLIHGGVRYLEQAVKKFDRTQFNLVRDALRERAILLTIAPHLTKPIPLVIPLYNWLEAPYYMAGLKMYDWLAGKNNVHPSRFVDSTEALQRFPMLRREGLRGGVIYHDGQFDDARMNVALALTAASHGATVANHVDVIGLLRTGGTLLGVTVRDTLTGEVWDVSASVVVNATGPFTDSIRFLDDPAAPAMVSASSGAHVILDKKFSPPDTGLLIPETEDGRVIFLLPWVGHTLAGTTDDPAEIELHPRATEGDVAYILRHLAKYFAIPVTRADVTASWSGLRPLVADTKAADTAKLSRDHVINVSSSGLITIAGGKWTTYRKMAADTVDAAIAHGGFQARPSRTDTLKLVGGQRYRPTGAGLLQERYGFSAEVASYVNRAYGDQAEKVADIAAAGHDALLAEGHAYLTAEVIYGARYEGARTSIDILARRTRLAFLDEAGAIAAVPVTAALLAAELGWSTAQRDQDIAEALAYLG